MGTTLALAVLAGMTAQPPTLAQAGREPVQTGEPFHDWRIAFCRGLTVYLPARQEPPVGRAPFAVQRPPFVVPPVAVPPYVVLPQSQQGTDRPRR